MIKFSKREMLAAASLPVAGLLFLLNGCAARPPLLVYERTVERPGEKTRVEVRCFRGDAGMVRAAALAKKLVPEPGLTTLRPEPER